MPLTQTRGCSPMMHHNVLISGFWCAVVLGKSSKKVTHFSLKITLPSAECVLWTDHDKLNPGLMIVLSAAAWSAPIYHHPAISLCQCGISPGHSKPRTTILKYARVTLIPAESIIEIFHLSDSSILAPISLGPGVKMLSITGNSPKSRPRAVYWKTVLMIIGFQWLGFVFTSPIINNLSQAL